MPVNAAWDDAAHTIIRYELIGNWTWDEYFATRETLNAMLDSVSHPIYVIIDVGQMRGVPMNALSEMARGTQRAQAQRPNWAGGYFVGVNPLFRTLFNVFRRINPQMAARYQTAETLEEARRMIAARQTPPGD